MRDIITENLKLHLKALSCDIGSRSLSEPASLAQAQAYISKHLTSFGLDLEEQPFRVCGVDTANVVACIGEITAGPPVHLIGAHYDTVPGTPGADDNASAVAVLLECARMLSQSGKGVSNTIIAAFSAEEPPAFGTRMMGSRVFVRSLKASGWKVAGALILEMVGYYTEKPKSQQIPLIVKMKGISTTGNFIAVVGDRRSKKLVEDVAGSVEKYGSGLPVERLAIPASGYILPQARLSDNASFWDAGIPAVMITDTAFLRNPNYHMPSDTADTLDYGSMARLTLALTKYFMSRP